MCISQIISGSVIVPHPDVSEECGQKLKLHPMP